MHSVDGSQTFNRVFTTAPARPCDSRYHLLLRCFSVLARQVQRMQKQWNISDFCTTIRKSETSAWAVETRLLRRRELRATSSVKVTLMFTSFRRNGWPQESACRLKARCEKNKCSYEQQSLLWTTDLPGVCLPWIPPVRRAELSLHSLCC